MPQITTQNGTGYGPANPLGTVPSAMFPPALCEVDLSATLGSGDRQVVFGGPSNVGAANPFRGSPYFLLDMSYSDWANQTFSDATYSLGINFRAFGATGKQAAGAHGIAWVMEYDYFANNWLRQITEIYLAFVCADTAAGVRPINVGVNNNTDEQYTITAVSSATQAVITMTNRTAGQTQGPVQGQKFVIALPAGTGTIGTLNGTTQTAIATGGSFPNWTITIPFDSSSGGTIGGGTNTATANVRGQVLDFGFVVGQNCEFRHWSGDGSNPNSLIARLNYPGAMDLFQCAQGVLTGLTVGQVTTASGFTNTQGSYLTCYGPGAPGAQNAFGLKYNNTSGYAALIINNLDIFTIYNGAFSKPATPTVTISEDNFLSNANYPKLYVSGETLPVGNDSFYVNSGNSRNATTGLANSVVTFRAKTASGNCTWRWLNDGVMFIGNTVTAPAAVAVGGGYLYVEAGALKYRGTVSAPTTIAPA